MLPWLSLAWGLAVLSPPQGSGRSCTPGSAERRVPLGSRTPLPREGVGMSQSSAAQWGGITEQERSILVREGFWPCDLVGLSRGELEELLAPRRALPSSHSRLTSLPAIAACSMPPTKGG